MKPRVYIDKEFLERFDEVKPNEEEFQSVDNVTENKNQLSKAIWNSQLYCSGLSKKEMIRLHTMNGNASLRPKNFKDFCLVRALGKDKLSFATYDLDDSSAIFLLNKTEVECDEIISNHNVICSGINYAFEKNVIPKSFASKSIDNQMNGIEKISHRCRNIVMMDPHLFDDSSKRLEPKIPNVIKFLKTLHVNNDITNCHLSIITWRDLNKGGSDALYERKITEIKDGVGNPNLIVSVFAYGKKHVFEGNRRFITDYALMDAQHIFDRNNASISVNFLFDGDGIKQNFKETNDLLKRIKDVYKNEPKMSGLITQKFGNMLDNKLFD